MNVVDFLKIDSSRLNADLIVEKFEEDHSIFNIILEVMYTDTYPLSMRASRKEPELKPELIDFFEAQLPTDSKGIDSRIKEVLKRLRNETR